MTDIKCVPCEGIAEPFTTKEVEERISSLCVPWCVNEGWDYITRSFKFNNWAKAMKLVEKISLIAEEEGHHPDIKFGWGYVDVKLTTHAINGLSENDFIVARRIDKAIVMVYKENSE